jgi:phosphate transport system ATP-binding protein
MTAEEPPPSTPDTILSVRHLTVRSPERTILSDISLDIYDREVTAIIGPSGCGKTTLVRSLNRMTEVTPGIRVEGSVQYRGEEIYDPRVSPVVVRQKIGMVFQRPVPFPLSIYENVAFGLRLQGADEERIDRTVMSSLEKAGLWKELDGDVDRSALTLSGGQQQRLCIARALAVQPRVLLLDEPSASLDPTATQKIEELLFDLRREYAVIIVTHNMQQAARVANRTAFLYQGRLVEYSDTHQLFENPREKLSESYVTGRFG